MNINEIEKIVTDFMEHFSLDNFYLLILVFDKETSSWKDYNNGNKQLYELDAISKNNYQKGKVMHELNSFFDPIKQPYKIQRNKPKNFETTNDVINRLEGELAKKDETIKELRVELTKKDQIIYQLRNEVKELKNEIKELKTMFAQHMKEFH